MVATAAAAVILVPPRPSARAGDLDDLGVSKTARTSEVGARPVPIVPAPRAPAPDARLCGITNATFRPVSGGLIVEAEAGIANERPGARYLWTVEIRNDRSETIADLAYPERLIEIAAGDAVVRPTFEEFIPLEPGAHAAFIRLTRLPDGVLPPEGPDAPGSIRMARKARVVVVP